jgi:drug/metabolite transporter (DMT)-like permease
LTAILLALSASLAWGFADFGAGASTRRLPAFVVASVSQVSGLVLVAVVVLASGAAAPTGGQFAWALGAGVVGMVGLSAFYRAMAVGSMGVIGPITATAAVVPLGYGLARGDRPSGLQAAGVALAVAGVIAASVEPRDAAGGRRVGAGIGLALVAAASFGFALIGIDKAAEGGAAWATLGMRVAGAPIVLALALLLTPRAPGSSRAWLVLVGVGVLDTGATLLYAIATTKGLLSVVSVLSSLYPIVIVVLARVLLSERVARTQLAGVAVALAGVALISAG